MNLDLDLLRTFIAIAESETFASAADRVHRTQSAVSQQMQRLESQLGVSLFQREGRGKFLTPRGLQLLSYSRRLLSLHDEACTSLLFPELDEPISIGTTYDMADTLLPNLLKRFTKIVPHAKFNLHIHRSPQLMEKLKRGEIELAISTRKTEGHPSTVLRRSPSVWLCAADFEFDSSLPVPLILSDAPSLFRQYAIESLDKHNIPWRVMYLCPALAGIAAAVRAGVGVTVRLIEMLGPDLKLLGEPEGLPPLPTMTYYLYLRKGTTGAAARLFDAARSTH